MRFAQIIGAVSIVAVFTIQGVVVSQTQPADGSNPSVEDVEKRMQRLRNQRPIQPTPILKPGNRSKAANAGTAAGRKNMTAAEQANGKATTKRARREGDSITMRTGKIVPTTGGAAPWMFRFTADNGGEGDAPIFLMPCQLLQDMENYRGKELMISGRVYLYHGNEYMLPTLMKVVPKRGNLGL